MTPTRTTPTADHLHPDTLERAQRHLVAKALSELAHERLLVPTPLGDGRYEVRGERTTYTFAAQVLALDHWVVDPASVRAGDDGCAPLDALDLLADHHTALGIPDSLLPTYLEEVASTLAAACWKLAEPRPTAADLVHAGYQEIEAAMTEGHPAFVANNGRIGFGVDDHAAYAPETGARVRLLWVAARRSLTRLSLGSGLTEADLYAGELDPATRQRFDARLDDLGLDPSDYLLLPVHPWQWRTRLAVTFSPDVARRDLVLLGEGDDEHQPQQSIRTFFNISRPDRHYVKTALAIQNMGFLRGLSPAYMEATPAINDWVASVVDGDAELAGCGFRVVREVAAIGYTGDAFHRLATPSPYRKMVAALWRESPVPTLAAGQRLATMASLLHRDEKGTALLTELITASGLDAPAWVRAYLRAYVRPIVHCLLAHDLAFMPHGENLVLVLEDHVVTGAIMKDIGEEVAVMSPDRPLPADVERIRATADDDVRALALFTDVFDGVLRYVAAILHTDGVLAQDDFWALVGDVVREHHADHPELAEAAAEYDLFRAEFPFSCLNRLQLRNTLAMVDLADQADSLIFAGMLANPIA